jgi:cytochrome c-type biogenesis protein CcmH
VLRLVLLLVVTLAAPASAQTADLEKDARQLETMLIAPCCFSQQVSLHQSEAATDMKRDIRQRLAAGETRQHILDAYVAQYGKRILVEPPAEGFDRILYVLPPLGLILTAALTVVLVRRFAARGAGAPAAASAASSQADSGYSATLDDELRDLD